MLTKKDAKVRVDQIKSTMAHLIGVPVLISLGPHEFEMVIADVTLATVAGLAVTPEKVYNPETGKYATPQVMQIVFKAGEVVNIVLDDVDDFSVGIRGATFTIGSQVLKVLHGNKDSSAA